LKFFLNGFGNADVADKADLSMEVWRTRSWSLLAHDAFPLQPPALEIEQEGQLKTTDRRVLADAALVSIPSAQDVISSEEKRSREISWYYLSCKTSAPRFSQRGFNQLMSSTFLIRDHFFSLDSRAIASRTLR